MRRKRAVFLVLIVLVSVVACLGCVEEEVSEPEISGEPSSDVAETGGASETPQTSEEPVALSLETFNGGFFTIDKPQGWNIYTAGSCADFAFLLRDPQDPLRQVFFFGEVGPVYMSEEQKQIDYDYMSMGGYPIQYIEMPVVDPLTPENFLQQFHLITETSIAQSFMPQAPPLEHFEVISTTSQSSFISGGTTELVRGLFVQDGAVAEGLFLVTVAPVLPAMGGPGGDIAYGFQVMGITAPKQEFRYLENSLAASMQSFTVSQSYAQNCMQQQAQTYGAILEAGKTLSEASDIIMDGWESRNKVDDIVAEKRSDAILGNERVYDPETGEVYEVENGFYDTYNTNRDQYEMNNLQPLPDDSWDLWTAAPLDGGQYIR
ncbi:MAG: hypothetical protein JW878_03835 [Methanomicrobia archaeon]|nr:hypothetical protein [Methanomicrobia archaeon]